MIFRSARLIARRFDPRDLEAFVAMRDNPDVARFQSWSGFSLDDGRKFLGWIRLRNPGDQGWFQFALEHRDSGAFIGDCGLHIMEHDRRLAQLGFTIARPHWNQGYASEVVTSLVNYAFAGFELHRITASVDPRNTASCRVLEKTGFRKEAHFLRSEWFKGGWADDAIYARLRPE